MQKNTLKNEGVVWPRLPYQTRRNWTII